MSETPDIREMLAKTRNERSYLSRLSDQEREDLLFSIAEVIAGGSQQIIEANLQDCRAMDDSNPKKEIPKFLQKNNFNDILIFIDKELSITNKLDVKIMPTTIVLNRKFEEISRVEGYINWIDQRIVETFRELL